MNLNERQTATILAALRLWQYALILETSDKYRGRSSLLRAIKDMAGNSGQTVPLSVAEIDDLCEAVNTDRNADANLLREALESAEHAMSCAAEQLAKISILRAPPKEGFEDAQGLLDEALELAGRALGDERSKAMT